MPLFNSQIHWQGIGTTVAVVLLTLLVLAFAVVSYVEWSSNVAEFMSATEASASDPNHSNEPPAPIQSLRGRTGCPQGKRPLPTELIPLQ
ncbi:hypothetical protein V1288_005102 [Bradyrhizobium sp. AZCC 2176]